MSRSKIAAALTVVLFILGLVVAGPANAGEKIKWTGTSTTIETKQIEVGDEEGHVMLINKAKQIYMLPTGEKRVGVSVNTMDLNPKMNQFSLRGVGWVTDKDGDKVMRVHEGKPAGKGHWKGTYYFTKGTGKFEGIKGGGTWDSYSMGQGHPSFLEIVGEQEIPKK